MSKSKEQHHKNTALNFTQLMHNAGVVPIKKNQQKTHTSSTNSSKNIAAMSAKTHLTPIPTQQDPFSDQGEIKPLSAADRLSYCSHSIQKTVFRKFRRGHFPIADELDLHGLNRIEARELLLDFLKYTVIPSRHCIRIIHGKGHRSTGKQAILKTQVNHWLKQHKRVLAFHSCQPADGGTGAVYVLLRLFN